MRRRVIAGNWKMFKTQSETRAFFSAFAPLVGSSTNCDIVIAPPFTAIPAAVEVAKGTNIAISGQDVFWEKDGAFTGEISANMLVEAGCRYVIIGHSERRQFFGETDETVAKKTKAALAAGLTPIVCLGELLSHREAGQTHHICKSQFTGGVAALTADEFSRILIAYEPVWAIGTGRTATPEIASDVHRFLRQCAAERFSAAHASALRILYGGSVKPDNIQGLMAQEELDGALVGGASLDAKSFATIVSFA
ncbi:MAG: triose-phosphate isomerase [Acidobacteria bacterium]|nr:MAG: triose-phosphate isomerase [Acidobacteria bacterium 13_1_40CM_4_58_4]PYT60363.1 MAG: triose-phosphate isomerase [Acidobacteriota bacterium]